MPRPRLARALALALLSACFSDPGLGEGTADPSTGATGTTDAPTGTTGPSSLCGDGVQQSGEECDDGPLNGSYAACSDQCALNVCGDGVIGPLEACDDADDDDSDACTNACTRPRCGDGVVSVEVELCDDANIIETDACASTCLPVGCGDGVLQRGEGCDHGPLNADDAACTLACAPAACGDGLLGPGEPCEPALDAACAPDCKLLTCGNGALDPGEPCETTEPDCTPRCTMNVCGNGFMLENEQCDDGNKVDDDGCSNQCKLTVCGDKIVQPGETCDDGNPLPGDGCVGCLRDARFAFVTAATFTGAIGGLAAADAACTAEAEAAGLPGTYFAWLFDGIAPPAARFGKSALPYILPGEGHEVVAEDWLALVTGAMQSPIFRTAEGTPVAMGQSCAQPDLLAWTHAKATGSPSPGVGCSGFLASDGVAVAGLVNSIGLAWTEGCPDVPCDQALRLYCFEQP